MEKLSSKILPIICAALLTAAASAGWLNDIEARVSDWLYQKPGAISSDIVVIGIDSNTLNELGPLGSWARRDIATVIDRLNENPATRPAAIGIDLLFTGENPTDAASDARLAEVAAQCGNVVVGSAVIMSDDDLKDLDSLWDKAYPLDAPYDALLAAADTGHICQPLGKDGIVRRQLLFVNVEGRGRLYSFARVLYEKWCRVKGIAPNAPPATKGNGLFPLSFTAKSYSDGVSFVDLLKGRARADVYGGKIVLIGSRAPGMGDEFLTALDRSDSIYGVDIHANAVQAFQENFFPRPLDKPLQAAILFVVCLLAAILFRNGKMQSVFGQWAIICIGWLIACVFAWRQGVILHAVWVPFGVSVVLVGSVAINYVTARAEKDLVTATFGRYVDPTIMNQLLDGGAKLDLGGTVRNIAVLFVDIRGFTTMSEQLPAPAVVEILNRYLTLTSDCIRRHHGTLDKFVGDCTMAFWNAPLTQEKPVHLACRAALDMIHGSESLKAELKARYGREISFGIGIHWGSAVVGNIGSPFRMDYTAIGDTVNTAARLEANAPGGKIFISRAVADILGSQASVTSLGDSVKLKGKAAGFEVLILDSLNETEG